MKPTTEQPRIKITWRLTPDLVAALQLRHTRMLAEHRSGADRWRRAPSLNDAAERILALGLTAADADRHARKLRELNDARAPKRTIKRTRKAVSK